MKSTTIINNIKSKRKSLKLSQSQIAEKLHISLKAYQNIENGFTKMDIDRLDQLAQILDTNILHLICSPEELHKMQQEQRNEDRKLFEQIVKEKERYISLLEDSVRIFKKILNEK